MSKGAIRSLIPFVAVAATLVSMAGWEWEHHTKLMLISYDRRYPHPESGEIYPFRLKGITVYGRNYQREAMARSQIALFLRYGGLATLLICIGINYWLSRKPQGKADHA